MQLIVVLHAGPQVLKAQFFETWAEAEPVAQAWSKRTRTGETVDLYDLVHLERFPLPERED